MSHPLLYCQIDSPVLTPNNTVLKAQQHCQASGITAIEISRAQMCDINTGIFNGSLTSPSAAWAAVQCIGCSGDMLSLAWLMSICASQT